MIDILNVADDADVIINGYAFKRKENGVSVLNLNNPDKASFLSYTGEILETTMDDIELSIVHDYFQRGVKYLEVQDAEIL